MEILVLYKEIINELGEMARLKKECERSLRMNDRIYLEYRIIDILAVASSLTQHADELKKIL